MNKVEITLSRSTLISIFKRALKTKYIHILKIEIERTTFEDGSRCKSMSNVGCLVYESRNKSYAKNKASSITESKIKTKASSATESKTK